MCVSFSPYCLDALLIYSRGGCREKNKEIFYKFGRRICSIARNAWANS